MIPQYIVDAVHAAKAVNREHMFTHKDNPNLVFKYGGMRIKLTEFEVAGNDGKVKIIAMKLVSDNLPFLVCVNRKWTYRRDDAAATAFVYDMLNLTK